MINDLYIQDIWGIDTSLDDRYVCLNPYTNTDDTCAEVITI